MRGPAIRCVWSALLWRAAAADVGTSKEPAPTPLGVYECLGERHDAGMAREQGARTYPMMPYRHRRGI